MKTSTPSRLLAAAAAEPLRRATGAPAPDAASLYDQAHPAEAARRRRLLAERVIGFRIMRETEVAPGWWGRAVEVGETGSGTVADLFCREQNAMTMDPNRVKRIQFYSEPIYAEPVPPTDRADPDADRVRLFTEFRAARAVGDENRMAEVIVDAVCLDMADPEGPRLMDEIRGLSTPAAVA
ncbi:hypothetical protein [Streptomyces sp. NPDC059994]|uniref:hypothetical protein n=1 Tax=Streptomyces sp. NPDC059994 TaxID=3347029 RepID=UPI0036D0FB28